MSDAARALAEKDRNPSVDGGAVNPDEKIGYQPEYSWIASKRKALRDIMDTLWFEVGIIFLVCVYAVILFVDMTVSNSTAIDHADCQAIDDVATVILTNASLTKLCALKEELGVLFWLDMIFLIVFLSEIVCRLLGFGLRYLRDPVNTIDAVVVSVAFVSNMLDMTSNSSFQGANMLSVLRIVRLFRLAVIINKLERSRQAAAMRSKVCAIAAAAASVAASHARARALTRLLPPARSSLLPLSSISPLPPHSPRAARDVQAAGRACGKGARLPHRLPREAAIAKGSVQH